MGVSAVIILAAGKSRRMKTKKSKVLHKLLGKPMILYGLEAAAKLKPKKIILVVGKDSADLRAPFKVRGQECLRHCPKIEFAVQRTPRGTADAVKAALPRLKGLKGAALIFYADNPLFSLSTLRQLVREKEKSHARLALLTAIFPEPPAFGRIIRNRKGRVQAIIEQADCTPAQLAIKEVNPGLYCVDIDFLKAAIAKVKASNKQKEYYLTDIVKLAVDQKIPVAAAIAKDFQETFGINSRRDLALAGAIMREKINAEWMAKGVTIEDPQTVLIEPEVKIGQDTLIESGARLCGKTRIGKNCWIQASARIIDSIIDDSVEIRQGSVIEESRVKSESSVGPMAHLRPGSVVGKHVRIGNFVELKKAVIGDFSMAAHLTYLGDAFIGKRVNIGCGVITCNYDGIRKSTTIIEDNAFIGSDSQLVAPVRIGKGAYIGSGSTITKDVPPGALSLTRSQQIIKPDWLKNRKKK
jgi:bifunctional UDP-N-acetylglucosamine pyrophosphorylase/glucosamine-1-phosphate N-acetyltransferase